MIEDKITLNLTSKKVEFSIIPVVTPFKTIDFDAGDVTSHGMLNYWRTLIEADIIKKTLEEEKKIIEGMVSEIVQARNKALEP